MKKNIKLLLFIFMFIPLLSIKAVSSDKVNYKIENLLIDAKIDIAGNVNVKEVIVLDGTFNGYYRELVYKTAGLPEFTGKLSDFEMSDIYNATNITITKVGVIKDYDKIDYNIFSKDVTLSEEINKTEAQKGDLGKYYIEDVSNGKSVTMYNETIKGKTAFYLEYIIGNAVVLHNDCAELYYNFIGNSFDDDIQNAQIRVGLPYTTNDEIKVWAHGEVNGQVLIIKDQKEDKDIYYGLLATMDKLNSSTPVDIRMTYPKELFSVDHPFVKKSNVDALESILKVEQKRANEKNAKIKRNRKIVNTTKVVTYAYLLSLIGLTIYVYKKYDKEYESNFTGEYNREFIDDYDVEIVEYIIDRRITEKGFSASILNLIYKKNIAAEKLPEKKENYKFTKITDDNISDTEKIIMDLLFNKIGNGTEVTLNEIRKFAKKTSSNGENKFYDDYMLWKSETTKKAKELSVYEKNTGKKAKFILYSLIGIILFMIQLYLGFGPISLITLLFSFIFMIYIIAFTKRTFVGNDHYTKWKAFKKFLEDFGRFDEKELPEISLWERYLVYATVFGVADKVQKTMKLKLDTMNINTSTTPAFNDYIMFNSISNDISKSMTETVRKTMSAVASAKASYASGSGGGGGFSGGGGFGGGGGGGHGF